MKKIIISFLSALFFIPALAQDNTVTVVASGDGQTKNEAEVNALRSAVEQAYGVFVSANTSILNDEITRDEVATISSGNIKSYKEISSIVLADGTHTVMLQVVVSPDHLISYAKAKCGALEVDGGMFAIKRKMRELNKKNELTVLENLADFARNIGPEVFDTEVSFTDYVETKVMGSVKYKLPLTIKYKVNKAAENYFSTIVSTLQAITLSKEELDSYKANNTYYSTCPIADSNLIMGSGYDLHAISLNLNFRNNEKDVLPYLIRIFSAPYISKIIRFQQVAGKSIYYPCSLVYNNYTRMLGPCATNAEYPSDTFIGKFDREYAGLRSFNTVLFWRIPGIFSLLPINKRRSISVDIQKLTTDRSKYYAPVGHEIDAMPNADFLQGMLGSDRSNLKNYCVKLEANPDVVITAYIGIVVDETTLDSLGGISIMPAKMEEQAFQDISTITSSGI